MGVRDPAWLMECELAAVLEKRTQHVVHDVQAAALNHPVEKARDGQGHQRREIEPIG